MLMFTITKGQRMKALNATTEHHLSHLSKILATGLTLAALSNVAFAEDRVIEDSLVYNDPTVAHENQWVTGVALDYFNSSTTVDNVGSTATANLNYAQPGVSAYVGHGNLTAAASYRSGSGKSAFPTFSLNDKISQYLFSLRWLMTNLSTDHFTPYILGSYFSSNLNADAYTNNGTYLQTQTSNMTAPMVGIGAILPINSAVGFRIDGSYGAANSTGQTTAGSATSQTSSLTSVTATMYANIGDGWNAQVGLQSDQLKLTSASTSYTTLTGAYFKLGYTFK
jgi:hypothetical protein